jgi:hypothetical protein
VPYEQIRQALGPCRSRCSGNLLYIQFKDLGKLDTLQISQEATKPDIGKQVVEFDVFDSVSCRPPIHGLSFRSKSVLAIQSNCGYMYNVEFR